MTKAELISLVKNRLRKIDRTRKYGDKFISAELGAVITQVYNDMYRNDARDLDYYTSELIQTTISYDSTTDTYYALFGSGVKLMNLPDIRRGVRYVNAIQTKQMTFFPYTDRTLQEFIGLEADITLLSAGDDRRVGYKVLNDRITFYNIPSSIISSGVVMHVIYDFITADDDADFNLPGGQDSTFVDLTVAALLQLPPVDLENDNNDNPNG